MVFLCGGCGAGVNGFGEPTDYLKKLRKRDPELGSYLGTNCPQVVMCNADGKSRKILAGDVQHVQPGVKPARHRGCYG